MDAAGGHVVGHVEEPNPLPFVKNLSEILGREDPGWNPGRYVPSTEKIRNELGVTPTVGLDEAIVRTARWNGWSEWPK